MTDKLFIRGGIAFMILVPTAICIIGANETNTRKRLTNVNNVVIRLEDDLYQGKYNSVGADLRRFIIDQPERHRPLLVRVLPREKALLLEIHLRNLPKRYRQDVDVIRLHGLVRNYLLALDTAESGGILDMLPERDKEA